ncbi:alpha/beta fold hydrolase [Massilia sp. S19_KUP03_FR1]|uniref:alpha/beta fold hydrolase n=1 Tax=Massilia sp. S19_KUP03_FR1 TaxID=3025503 RepID=UPI003FA5DB0B
MFALFIFIAANPHAVAVELDLVKTSVPVVLDSRLTIQTSTGKGDVPVHISRDWTIRQVDVTRAIILVHGWPRRDLDADEYVSKHAGKAALDTIFITPQFLIQADVTGHQLPAATLRWDLDGWKQGYDAQAPAPVSSFDVIDSIIQRLTDRRKFPNLKIIVLAGHSAGGQFVQRYAVVGHGADALSAADIHVRYVVANPATYLYFTDKRMQSDGSFAVVDAKNCPGFSNWNMGWLGKLPAYVAQPVSVDKLEKAYLARDVVYLLGTADNDPIADALGMSCPYKIQGATRYDRGLAYAKYIDFSAQGHSNHRLMKVPNVGHHAYAMYSSTCGLAALFDRPGCRLKKWRCTR